VTTTPSTSSGPTGNTGPWKMPEELKPFEPYMRDLGAFSCEALMNMYGAKCAVLLVKAGESPRDPESIDLKALICNAQVGLLVALQGAGLLKTPGLAGGPKEVPSGDVR
jgi:hypothetical protein